jgi:hypothetical protein
MLAFYRALIALRRRLAPLRNGRKDLARVEHDEAGRWLAILRGDESGAATFTCANLGAEPAHIRVPDGTWRLALATDGAIASAAAGGSTVAVPPSTAAIYERVAAARESASHQ